MVDAAEADSFNSRPCEGATVPIKKPEDDSFSFNSRPCEGATRAGSPSIWLAWFQFTPL